MIATIKGRSIEAEMGDDGVWSSDTPGFADFLNEEYSPIAALPAAASAAAAATALRFSITLGDGEKPRRGRVVVH